MNFTSRKGLTFLFVLLSLPFWGPTLSAQLGNPIMIIRCRNFEENPELQSEDSSKKKNLQKTVVSCSAGQIPAPTTTQFIDEADFLSLVNTALEDYEGTITPDFSLSLAADRNPGPNDFITPPATPAEGVSCVADGTQAVLWTNKLQISFSQEITAFATYLYDLGDFGGSSVELKTSSGETWTELAAGGCGEIFTGIVTCTPFDEITIEVLPNSPLGNVDGIYIDRTFYGFIDEPCIPACYNGEVAIAIDPIDCNNLTNGLAEVRVCFTATNNSQPIQEGQFVTLDAISNCLDASGTPWIDQLPLPTDGEEYAFGPADEFGMVCAEFLVNPLEPLSITLLDQPEMIFPTCPNIPTIGQWGLFILGMILSSLAIVFIAVQRTIKA